LYVSGRIDRSMGYEGVFSSLKFQQEVEQSIFKIGDGSQKAPAQKLTDFINGKTSGILNSTSYIPGLHSTNLKEVLPDFVFERLKAGLKEFGKKMKNYHTDLANVVAVESRTSSPIKIPRHKEDLNHLELKNLFPCGEGAGYAGGILSAAMDGQNVAKAVFRGIK